jgi:hypothetical protein
VRGGPKSRFIISKTIDGKNMKTIKPKTDSQH